MNSRNEQETIGASSREDRDLEDALLDSIAGDVRFDSGLPAGTRSATIIPFTVLPRGAAPDRLEISLDDLAALQSPHDTDDTGESALDGLRGLIDELNGAPPSESVAPDFAEPETPAEPTASRTTEANSLLDELNALKDDLARLQTLADEEPEDAPESLASEPQTPPKSSVWQRLAEESADTPATLEAGVPAIESIAEDRPEPPARGEESAPPTREAHFEEAKKLIRDLDRTAEVAQPHAESAPALGGAVPDDADDDESYSLEQPAPRSIRRLRSSRRERAALPWKQFLVVTVAMLGAGLLGYQVYKMQIASPEGLLEQARVLARQGQWADASATYQRFTARYENHPMNADAVYGAAHALYVQSGLVQPRDPAAEDRALQLLDEFNRDYPGHPKAARAASLAGIILHRQGRHQAAIERLDAPGRRLDDPAGYLAVLRAMAGSYAALGQTDRAHTAYLEASALEGNVTPDRDILDLAAMYRRLAEDPAATPADRERFARAAIEQWENALLLPGLIEARKREIRMMRDVLAESARLSSATSVEPAG